MMGTPGEDIAGEGIAAAVMWSDSPMVGLAKKVRQEAGRMGSARLGLPCLPLLYIWIIEDCDWRGGS